MRNRRLAAVFAVFALVAKLVAPCQATEPASVGGPNAPIALCHQATTWAVDQAGSQQAPSDDLDDVGCSCALCHLGWSTLPPADDIFAINELAHHLAPRGPPTQAFVPSRLNPSAHPRGPPSFA
ncbi:MAG: hypothetical protein FJX45_18725 [Alphaproteobacteria bacterium]|nr:hypothetical protein [Alphaproteobacteria bacterium]MBM3653584.1 hypothetical protein [Alphaproteobacteria bacterium]